MRQSVRIRELERVFEHKHRSAVLPNNDDGYDHAFVMACHLAFLPDAAARITQWMQRWAPWLTAEDLADLIEMTTRRRTIWKADPLADRLDVDYELRQLLNLRTIGATDFRKRQRTIRRKKMQAERRRIARAKAGAHPHAQSAARTQPWKAQGVSRSTYYRAQRRTRDTAETVSDAPPAEAGTRG